MVFQFLTFLNIIQLLFHSVLLGVAGVGGEGVAGEVFKPGAGVVFEGEGFGGEGFSVFAASLPFVLGDVDDDAVEVGGDGGVAAEVGEGAVEAEEGFLGEVFDVGAGAGHARERAEDEPLVLVDECFKVLRRCEVSAHGGRVLRLQDEPKVSSAPLKLWGRDAV